MGSGSYKEEELGAGDPTPPRLTPGVLLKELDLRAPSSGDKEEPGTPVPYDPPETKVCPHCGQVFVTIGKRKKHIKEVDNVNKFPCGRWPKVYKTKANLK